MTTLDSEYIDPQDVKMMPTAFKYGLIGAGLSILIGLIANVLDLNDFENPNSATNWILSIASYLIIISAIVLAIKQHRDKELGGFIKMGRAIGIGVLTALIMGIFTMIWTYVFMAFIDPTMITEISNAQREAMEQQGLSDEELEAALPWVEMMASPAALSFFALIANVLFGLLVSVIAGAIMKRENPMA